MKKISISIAVAIAAMMFGWIGTGAYAAGIQGDQFLTNRAASNAPDFELWRDVVSPSRYGIALPRGEDGQTAFRTLGPGNWILYQDKKLPQQGIPDQKYHNQALEYQGTSNPGQQGLWDPRDQWPF